MTDSTRQNTQGVAHIPDRDRLYREWILPRLELSDEHRSFLQNILGIGDTQYFRTYPGHVHVQLDEAAPLAELNKLPCCLIRGTSMTLVGPREGALLIPVLDVQGRMTAYQLLHETQIEEIKANQSPGKIRWWGVSGAPKPMMPNGELPLSVARTQNRDTNILCHALAGAQIIAAKWQMTAISTTEDEFSHETLNQYLTELQPHTIALLIERQPSRVVCQRAWDLCGRLQESGWNLRMLVPVLSDLQIPERFGACTLIPVESWLRGLSNSIQNQLLGKDASDQLNTYLLELNKKRHVSATSKIKMAYGQMKDDTESISINSLAIHAGVAWATVRDWLKEQGIGDTATLRSSAEDGWEPPDPDLTPLITTSKADVKKAETLAPEEDHTLPLFEYAERQQAMAAAGEMQSAATAQGAELEQADKESIRAASQAITAEILPDNEYANSSADDVEIVVEAESVSVEGPGNSADGAGQGGTPPPPAADKDKNTQKADYQAAAMDQDAEDFPPSDETPPTRVAVGSPRLAVVLLIVLILTILVILFASNSNSKPQRLAPMDLPTEEELIRFLDPVEMPVHTMPPPELGESPYNPDDETPDE